MISYRSKLPPIQPKTEDWFQIHISPGGGMYIVSERLEQFFIDRGNCMNFTFRRTGQHVPVHCTEYCDMYECGTFKGRVEIDTRVYATTAVFISEPLFAKDSETIDVSSSSECKCRCDIHDLMNVGCRCGAITKERSSK